MASNSNENDQTDNLNVLQNKTSPTNDKKLVSSVEQILNRSIGTRTTYNVFKRSIAGLRNFVERFQISKKLMKQTCYSPIKGITLNGNGKLLASVGLDSKCSIWDWALNTQIANFPTYHTNIVCQIKYLNINQPDIQLITGGRDGKVRLHRVPYSNSDQINKVLFCQPAPIAQISIMKQNVQTILCASEDGSICSFDLRCHVYNNLTKVNNLRGFRNKLNSIDSNPINWKEFCVAGEDDIIRVFDIRNPSRVVNEYYSTAAREKIDPFNASTIAIYNRNGTEILASYRDEDIYLFDTTSMSKTHQHRYKGHMNPVSLAGISFFGSTSDYIISGSYCGNLYFWDKNTEEIVNIVHVQSPVKCIEVHPMLPMLATSCNTRDIQIWMPTSATSPDLEKLPKRVSCRGYNLMTELAARNAAI